MNDLTPIKITSNSEQITVSARDLHQALQIQTDFRHWFDRMTEYGFEEGKDFRTFLTESSGGKGQIYFVNKFKEMQEAA